MPDSTQTTLQACLCAQRSKTHTSGHLCTDTSVRTLQVQTQLAFAFPHIMLTRTESLVQAVCERFVSLLGLARARERPTTCSAICSSVYMGTAERTPPAALAGGEACAETTCTYRRTQGANGTTAAGHSRLHLLHLSCLFGFPGIKLEPPKDVACNL